MKVTINGRTKELPQPLSIEGALEAEGYDGMTVAVAWNGNFLPRGKYSDVTLREGDELEIVAPMQGG